MAQCLFFMIGFYFLVRGLKKQTFLLPASLFLGLSIFTYNSARIFVPLFLMSFLIIFWKQLKLSKLSILATILFGVFLIAGFYLAVFQDSSARYYWVRILDEGAISCYYEWMPKGLKKGSAACRWMEWNVSMSMIDAMERSERGSFVIQCEEEDDRWDRSNEEEEDRHGCNECRLTTRGPLSVSRALKR